MEIKGILYWPGVTDLVRFFIVSMITAHLYSKVVQENHEAASRIHQESWEISGK